MIRVPRILVIGSLVTLSACGSSQVAVESPAQDTVSGAPQTSVAAKAPSAQPSEAAGAAATKKAHGSITVTKSGFGIDRSMAGGGIGDFVWVASTLRNSTENISSVSVSFSLYDESGKVVGQQSSYTVLRSGQTGAAGTQIEVPHNTKIDKVVATASVEPYTSQKDDHPESEFVTKGVHYQGGQYTSKVLGEVVSHYQQSVTNVEVNVVCFDKSNKIIGGGMTFLDAIGHGQTVGFSAPGVIVNGTPAKCKAFAAPTMGSKGS